MRDEARWVEVIRPNDLKKLTPRIQEDLKIIKPPKKIETNSCYIFSGTSTGKTIHACFMLLQFSLVNYLNATHLGYDFITMANLLDKIKRSYKDDTSSEIVDYYSNLDFLILDDLGTSKPTEWVMETLYLLINNRYEGLKTTVFTSNYSLEELAEKLGDTRIPSRISRMGKILEKESTNKPRTTKS